MFEPSVCSNCESNASQKVCNRSSIHMVKRLKISQIKSVVISRGVAPGERGHHAWSTSSHCVRTYCTIWGISRIMGP